MKKVIVLAGICFSMIVGVSCGSNPRNDTNNPAQDSLATGGSDKKDANDNNVDNPRAMTNGSGNDEGAVQIANHNCKTCHAIDQKMTGPSYQQIAQRYTNDAGMQAELAHKIITGGYGRWGSVAMPAHPNVTEQQASQMAQYILSLKK